MENSRTEYRGISGSVLKWIAIVSMLIDHIGAVLLGKNLNGYAAEYGGINAVYDICRTIGRISFPIFCFLLVEGFCHTGNVKKYMQRLFLFAVLSELPFDLAFYGKIVALDGQNVFFTLFLGLLTLVAIKQMEYRWEMIWLAIALSGLAAWFLRTDYDYFGVLLISAFYLFRENLFRRNLAVGILCFWQPASLLALIPIQCYNGRRGGKLKYLFYIFYPGHLLLLWIVGIWI